MNTQQINEAIAKACGWEPVTGITVDFMWAPGHISQREAKWRHKDGRLSLELPAFASDLNDMHEAEQSLSDIESSLYRLWLEEICRRNAAQKLGYTPTKNDFWGASPIQRAEAFLRTKEMWEGKESPNQESQFLQDKQRIVNANSEYVQNREEVELARAFFQNDAGRTPGSSAVQSLIDMVTELREDRNQWRDCAREMRSWVVGFQKYALQEKETAVLALAEHVALPKSLEAFDMLEKKHAR